MYLSADLGDSKQTLSLCSASSLMQENRSERNIKKLNIKGSYYLCKSELDFYNLILALQNVMVHLKYFLFHLSLGVSMKLNIINEHKCTNIICGILNVYLAFSLPQWVRRRLSALNPLLWFLLLSSQAESCCNGVTSGCLKMGTLRSWACNLL